MTVGRPGSRHLISRRRPAQTELILHVVNVIPSIHKNTIFSSSCPRMHHSYVKPRLSGGLTAPEVELFIKYHYGVIISGQRQLAVSASALHLHAAPVRSLHPNLQLISLVYQ